MIDLYVHWGFHEEVEGQIDLSSPERDLQRFLDLAHDQGLLVMARPGPYICSETDGGGLPWWLHGRRARSEERRVGKECGCGWTAVSGVDRVESRWESS